MDKNREVMNGLVYFAGITKFRSINRAIRRGNVTSSGVIAPSRPFNNRANTSSRKKKHSRVYNQYKRIIYNNMWNAIQRTINKE